jgi:NADH-quinone oxidoreductase subunit D
VSTRVSIGLGTADAGLAAPAGMPHATLDLGAAHPTAHGVLRLELEVDGETIVRADPVVGHVHRGAEKLLESRDYRQGLALVNRHDWVSAYSGELGLALTVESMLGLEVPERAVWLRTLYAELTRTLAHLAFLGTFPVDGRPGGYVGFGEREAAVRHLEESTGGRLHHMAVRIGGLADDVPDGWLDGLAPVVAGLGSALDRIESEVLAPVSATYAGAGAIAREVLLAHGASGAVGRAGGVDLDLRRDEPYLAYAELGEVLRVPVRTASDVPARLEVTLEQARAALDLVRGCADRLRTIEGPVDTPLPKVLKAPEGVGHGAVESPLGAAGYVVVSRGEKTPWRVKLRTPSFAHASLLGEVLAGTRTRDLAATVCSLFLVIGDIDR